MITPLSASSLPDRSRSRSQPLSRSQSPALSASSHEFACQPSLCHEERFLEDLWSTTCLQASTSPLASFTPPLSLAHSLLALDLIDRCQPPVLCATDCDIVSCSWPTLRRASPASAPGHARPNTQVTLLLLPLPRCTQAAHIVLSQPHCTNCYTNCCAICHTTQNTS